MDMLPKAVQVVTQQLTRLPGIGPKSAQKLSLHLLRQPGGVITDFVTALQNLQTNVHTCHRCFLLADNTTCSICLAADRDTTTICVVADALAAEAIEHNGTFTGLYHVLGGILSPMDGVGPEQLTFAQLQRRLEQEPINELIVALDQTIESEATIRYLQQLVQTSGVRMTRLARGLPTGGDIEFADALTLGAAFRGREVI